VTLHVRERYRGMLSCALLVVVAGVFIGDRWTILLAGIPLLFVAFDAVSGVPNPDLAVEREITPAEPIPDDPVRVELTVRNEGSRTVPDARFSDGLPDDLVVTGGSASGAAPLPPGGSTTVSYTVRARRGTHRFEPPRVRVRGTAAGSYRDVRPEVEGDASFAARVFLEEPPTVRETSTLVGAVTSDAGGSGIEFHTVRTYRPGDPVNRIDWRRMARDGTLSTINFRERGGFSVVVIADCRREVETVRQPGSASGRTLCLYAADAIVTSLASEGHETGFLAVSDDAVPWIRPDTSDLQVRTRRALRAADGRGDWDGGRLRVEPPPDGTAIAERLLTRIQPETQLVVATPLADDEPLELTSDLRIHGHRVTVVSPDVGERDSPGSRLAGVERETRITRLRDAGATVVDWSRSDPLPVALSAVTGGKTR
jgi:uncharacterized protein (DUF58 family)